jgi:hypothetical protein
VLGDGPGGYLGSAADVQLGHHMMQVDFGGLFGDAEHPADLPVGPARGNQRGHLSLSPGKRHLLGAVRITGCGTRSDCHREICGLLGGHCPASVDEPVSVPRPQRLRERPLDRRVPCLLDVGRADGLPHAQRRGRAYQPCGGLIVRLFTGDPRKRLQALGDTPRVVDSRIDPQSLG